MGSLKVVLACCLLFLASCSKSASQPKAGEEGKPTVYVVNYPLKYFAERIAGDAATIVFPDMEGDPAYWAPEPDQVARYQSADMILLNGADYAKWVSKVSLPSSRMVDTGKGCVDQLIKVEEQVAHSHGAGEEHAHGGVAFTTWLDPLLAIEQARAIKEAFAQEWPDRVSDLETGFAALKKDLDVLDTELRGITSGHSGVPLVMSHPVYQYFERRYGLSGRSVHWEPEEAPSEEMWAELKTILSEHPAKWMIWEGQPMPETAAKLRELGVTSVVVDPCGNVPQTGDYLGVMEQNLRALRTVFNQRGLSGPD